jgi:hypothetical protein
MGLLAKAMIEANAMSIHQAVGDMLDLVQEELKTKGDPDPEVRQEKMKAILENSSNEFKKKIEEII